MKIAIFYDHIITASVQSGRSVDDLLDYLKECRIDAVELKLSMIEEDASLLSRLNAHGLSVSGIYEFYDWCRNDDFDRFMRHVDTAAENGVKNILVVPGFFTDDETDAFYKDLDPSDYFEVAKRMEASDAVARMLASLKRCCDYAKSKDVVVSIEDFDARNSPCTLLNQLRWLFDKLPDLRCAFDTGNFSFNKEDGEQAYLYLSERIVHVHCKDRNESLASVVTGSGLLPIEKHLRELISIGYDGYLVIEHFGLEDQLGAFKRSADFLYSCEERENELRRRRKSCWLGCLTASALVWVVGAVIFFVSDGFDVDSEPNAAPAESSTNALYAAPHFDDFIGSIKPRTIGRGQYRDDCFAYRVSLADGFNESGYFLMVKTNSSMLVEIEANVGRYGIIKIDEGIFFVREEINE